MSMYRRALLATNGWSAFIASKHDDCPEYDRSKSFGELEVNVSRTIAILRDETHHGGPEDHSAGLYPSICLAWVALRPRQEYKNQADMSS